MNNIGDRENAVNPCSGCGACCASCPKKCIKMGFNEEGFFRPVVDEQSCIGCGKCKKVCYQYLNSVDQQDGKLLEDCSVYAAIHKDAGELADASSGGVAGELSKYCYENGYDVFGVVMDPEEDCSQFVLAASKEDLERMKTSKYVQSDTSNLFLQMNRNHKTLVIGLPCQIYGIRKLIKQYGIEENFILVDLFCRGVPSVHLWHKYREYLQIYYGLDKLVRCNFRSKQTGWHKFSMQAFDIAGKEYQKDVYNDLFYSFYLKNSCLKESCYSCEFRHNRVYSDIRLGDFWGSKYYSHEEGVSIVSIYTKAGQEIWDQISKYFWVEENDPEELKLSQRFNRLPVPENRSDLLQDLAAKLPLDEIHRKYGLDKSKFYNAKN